MTLIDPETGMARFIRNATLWNWPLFTGIFFGLILSGSMYFVIWICVRALLK